MTAATSVDISQRRAPFGWTDWAALQVPWFHWWCRVFPLREMSGSGTGITHDFHRTFGCLPIGLDLHIHMNVLTYMYLQISKPYIQCIYPCSWLILYLGFSQTFCWLYWAVVKEKTHPWLFAFVNFIVRNIAEHRTRMVLGNHDDHARSTIINDDSRSLAIHHH